jgi:uncharacterized integral membrane protein
MATSPQVGAITRILVVANLIIFISKNGDKNRLKFINLAYFLFILWFFLFFLFGSLLDGLSIKASFTWEYSCVR